MKLEIKLGDITEEEVDAVVNPANEYLKLGSGVAGAILRKGGKIIQDECDKIGYCQTGKAVITTGGSLKAKYVIHAVGPIWKGGNSNEDELLYSAVESALMLAHSYNLKSISFPAISTGIFGFPKERASKIIISAILEFMKKYENRTSIEVIRICLFDKETYGIFLKTYENIGI
ncbi:MAG: macro domain-containing protein [candidate division WOR-3 bacterium]|nr:macro domain-containing protein [candidate division WOR-3 bacterium]MCX7947958.1 macro domain-containing protein [candidate division WOR-3 bacterium]MDW8150902.1 macro domain-containing protein [candidate division WOR-3 bacterium]